MSLMRSTIRSRPIDPSSGRPAEKAIPALVVPSAGKPARAKTFALPASQTFGRTKASGRW
jgi:hypothetical protein